MANYYIATAANGGDNANTGLIGDPWLTLVYACDNAVTVGDVINVGVGTFPVAAKASLRKGVSIVGAGDTSIISSTYAAAATIDLSSPAEGTDGNQSISYIKMDGNALTADTAIEINARKNVKIHHCTIEHFLSWGVIFNGLNGYGAAPPDTYATGNECYNNIITDCASYGGGYGHGCLAVGGQEGMLVHHNIITVTSRGGSGSHGWPWKYYSDGYNKGLKIYNNTFDKPAFNGDWDFAMEFCQWEQGGIEIYNNIIIGSIDIGARRKGTYTYSFYIHNSSVSGKSLNEPQVLIRSFME